MTIFLFGVFFKASQIRLRRRSCRADHKANKVLNFLIKSYTLLILTTSKS